MPQNYIVIITDERLPFDSFVSRLERIDFITVGKVFHGRHFNGRRPNILIDQTSERSFNEHAEKWAEHVISGLSKDVRVIGLGVVAQLFKERYGKRIFDTRNAVEYVRRSIK